MDASELDQSHGWRGASLHWRVRRRGMSTAKVEKDAALRGRSSRSMVEEPTSKHDQILAPVLRESMSLHHVCGFGLGAGSLRRPCRSAISPTLLPDKAIDLMDEGRQRLRMEVDSKPEALGCAGPHINAKADRQSAA